jgi:hypothetical protein
MQDEHRALQNSATWVRDMFLKRSDEVSYLAVALSSTVDLIEGRVDAATVNGVHWEAWLVLTTVLSHFLEMEPELELLGSVYNVDLT